MPVSSARGAGRSRPNFRDEAFVVRTHKLGEADLILVLLTKEHGIVRGVAKGIRKTRSRFGARLDRFSRVNVQLYPGRSLYSITDAATVATYAPPLIADVDCYYAGSAALEMAQLFASEPSAADEIFLLLDATLRLLSTDDLCGLTPVSVVDRFVLQCLDVAGWAPSLVDCAQCGAPGPHRAFHAGAGGAVCVRCRPPGAFTPPPQAVRGLWMLSKGRLGEAATIFGDANLAATAHDLLLAHVRQQLEVPCPVYAAL